MRSASTLDMWLWLRYCRNIAKLVDCCVVTSSKCVIEVVMLLTAQAERRKAMSSVNTAKTRSMLLCGWMSMLPVNVVNAQWNAVK
mmetsp:Transcript_61183/g.115374  ORF Transcript_61183/g.115374 Transcript_61183/m.115374 type:complete len:85 (-) Transcript_61183:1111-1365(-)